MKIIQTIYTMRDGNLYQDTTLEGTLTKSSNFKIVKIRQDRVCACCNTSIVSGTSCLTRNRKYKGREWFCSYCSKYFVPMEVKEKVVGYFANGKTIYFCEEVHPILGYLSSEEALFLKKVNNLDLFYIEEDYIEEVHKEAYAAAIDDF